MTPSEYIRQYTPFRLYVVKLTEFENNFEKYDKFYVAPWFAKIRWGSLFPESDEDNIFVCCLYTGKGNWEWKASGLGYIYWYYKINPKSETIPTQDDVINDFFRCCDEYNKDTLAELLTSFRDDFQMDLNQYNLEQEEYKRYCIKDNIIPLLYELFYHKKTRDAEAGVIIISDYFDKVEY